MDLSAVAARIETTEGGGVKETTAIMLAADVLAKSGHISDDDWVQFTKFLTTGAYQDAAMVLVPSSYGFKLDRYWLKEREAWTCILSWGLGGNKCHAVDAHTAGLAIAAAAVKARV